MTVKRKCKKWITLTPTQKKYLRNKYGNTYVDIASFILQMYILDIKTSSNPRIYSKLKNVLDKDNQYQMFNYGGWLYKRCFKLAIAKDKYRPTTECDFNATFKFIKEEYNAKKI